jgi:predicted neuraminidase
MFNSTLVYETIPGVPSCHCSSLIILPNNQLYLAFFAGQFEKAQDVAIWGATLNLNDVNLLNWTPPKILAKTPNKSMGSPIWYLTPQKKLYLSYLVMHHGRILPAGWSVCTIQAQTSIDFGLHWSKPFYLRRFWFWVTRALPIIANNHSVIIPVHREMFSYQSMMYINSKEDLTGKWKRYGRLKTPRGCLEPSITKLTTGQILCAMRTLDGYVYFCRSDDDGHTWSNPIASQFSNPNSQCIIYTLKSGKNLLVLNPIKRNEGGRSRLSISISEDHGYTWSRLIDLENDPGKEFSYPCLVQGLDEKIHLTYTFHRKSIKYSVFDEEWLNSQIS